VDDTDKEAGGSCHGIGTAGNIRHNDEGSVAAIPAGVVAEYVLANTRARAWERRNDGPSLANTGEQDIVRRVQAVSCGGIKIRVLEMRYDEGLTGCYCWVMEGEMH
jgi:hypothetical protein